MHWDDSGAGRSAKLRDHGQVFGGGEMVVEVRLLGDVAHAALVGDQVVLNRCAFKKMWPKAARSGP